MRLESIAYLPLVLVFTVIYTLGMTASAYVTQVEILFLTYCLISAFSAGKNIKPNLQSPFIVIQIMTTGVLHVSGMTGIFLYASKKGKIIYDHLTFSWWAEVISSKLQSK